MKKRIVAKRIFSILMVLCMIIGLMPAAAFAVDVSEEMVYETVLPQMDEDSEDLFAGYVQKQMYWGGASPFASSYGETVLTGINLSLYRALKPEIIDIAANGGSTEIKVESALFGDIRVPYDENYAQAIHEQLSAQLETRMLMEALLADCAYELYWFDKTNGMGLRYSMSGNSSEVWISSITVTFYVSEGYRASGYTADAPAVTSDVSAVTAAAANAANVVLENENLSDREKLDAYRDYIMEQVSYNDTAAAGGVAYGDPWQLVYVFDNDSDTNVVCEGYSKAFQYLCELSEFEGDISCYSVSGDMIANGSGGAHMWNIVSMNGGSYLADITNSDEGTIGHSGALYMNAEPTYGDANGYTITINAYNSVTYSYDTDTLALYPTSLLTLHPGEQQLPPAEGIAIAPTNFPDDIFRSYVAKFDTDGNGAFSDEELAAVKVIDVSLPEDAAESEKIKEITGLAYFTALEQLFCDNNLLTGQLGTFGLVELKIIRCSGNQLTDIHLPATPKLEFLDCSDNQLVELVANSNPYLINLDCSNNQIGFFNLGDIDIQTVDCSHNNIGNLDVMDNLALKELNCSDNYLTELIVSNNLALEKLDFCRTEVTQPDLSYNTALQELRCDGNGILTLELSENENLTYLSCADNSLSALDVSGNTKLTHLICDGNPIGSLETGSNTALEVLSANECNLTALTLAANTQLQKLSLSGNQLSALDLSCHTALTELDVSENQLSQLDLSSNTGLTKLYCSENSLYALDVSNLDQLADFVCANNLYELSVSAGRTFALSALSDFDLDKATNWVGGSVVDGVLTVNENVNEVSYQYDCGGKMASFCFAIVIEGAYILISTKNFPDENFRSYVSETLDTDHDGRLTAEERNAVTEIRIDREEEQPDAVKIRNLTGIEQFGNLQTLICDDNLLTELNLANNTKLTWLSCGNNMLNSLDISALAQLQLLYCQNNNLQTLDLSNNLELSDFDCCYNLLTKLDLSANTELSYLNCTGNLLTELDVSKNTALNDLSCGWMALTELDLSKNVNLTSLWCYQNQFTSLDLSNNSSLNSFFCLNNSYAVTVGKERTLDLSSLPGSFDVNRIVGEVAGGSLQGSILTLDPYATQVTYTYDCGGGYQADFTIQVNEIVEAVVVIGERRFPDPIFRSYVQNNYDLDKNGILDTKEILDITHMNVYGMEIQSLKGIEYFTALLYLECNNNKLTVLNLSKNHALQSLMCSGNQLKALNLSSTPNLTELDCSQNQLTTLDVSMLPSLRWLMCGENRLTELDLSCNLMIKDLECSCNKLTQLELSHLENLNFFECYGNGLTSLKLHEDAPIETFTVDENRYTIGVGADRSFSLDRLPGSFDVDMIVGSISGGSISGNTLTVNTAATQVIYTYDCGNGKEMQVTLWIDDSRIALTANNFPDPIFLLFIKTTFDQNQDGYLDQNEINQINQIVFGSSARTRSRSGSSLPSDLTGIEYFTALETLVCTGTEVEELDLSKNTNLSTVTCSDNAALTKLTLGTNAKLSTLTISDNQLDELDLTGLSKLQTLECSGNSLTELDLSCNGDLQQVSCSNNQLTVLNLTDNPDLQSVECSDNQIIDLNVYGCSMLTSVSCANNALTSVDTEGCEALNNVAVGTQTYGIKLADDNTFDLKTLPGGFDYTKAEADSFVGGSVDANGILTVEEGKTQINYNYNLDGVGLTAFTLYVQTGVTVSGSFTSYGDTSEITITLEGVAVKFDTKTGSYSFTEVMPGTYTLTVSKKNHVTRSYEVIVADENVVVDVEIWLLGDVTGEGLVNVADYRKVLKHVKKQDILEGYRYDCADVTGEGLVNVADYRKVLQHVKKLQLLW